MDRSKIHYLNLKREESVPASSSDETLKRLEEQLVRMERELKRTADQLTRREKRRKEGHPSESANLVANLEKSLRQISEEVKRATQSEQHNKSDMQVLWEGAVYLLSLFSYHSLRELLHDVWFGRHQEENFEFDEFGFDPAFSARVKPLFDFLYQSYWRVTVKGIRNLPQKGRGLIVANHSGTLPYDGAMIRVSVANDHPARRDVRFLVEDFVYHFPFLGTFMYRIGGVRACPENAERLLQADHLVAVFPEGVKGIGKPFKERYRLQRFGRGGFIRLAIRTRSPIIPTAVIGAEEIHPILYKSTALAKPLGIPYLPITPTLPWLGPLGLIPLPSKWTIVYGEPIHLDQYTDADLEDRILVSKLTEQVRASIQSIVTEELRRRRSVWFG